MTDEAVTSVKSAPLNGRSRSTALRLVLYVLLQVVIVLLCALALHHPLREPDPHYLVDSFTLNDRGATNATTLPAFVATRSSMDDPALFSGSFAWTQREQGKPWSVYLPRFTNGVEVFVNGVEIGHMNIWNAARNYKVPAGVAKGGRNVIAVRVLDTAGPGGFAGADKDLRLGLVGDDKAEPISLAGDWSFKGSTPLGDLSSPPEPAGSNPNRVTVLYNGMIAPLRPISICACTSPCTWG